MNKVVFFDGVCNLCNGYVQWVITRDKKGEISFSSLQSDVSREILSQHSIDLDEADTIYYLKNGEVYTFSDVALEVCKDLGGMYRLVYIFKIIPRFIRDVVYRFIAKNRYRLFGKKVECMIPKPEWKGRFID